MSLGETMLSIFTAKQKLIEASLINNVLEEDIAHYRNALDTIATHLENNNITQAKIIARMYEGLYKEI